MRRAHRLLTLGTLTGAAIAAWSTHAAAQTAPGFALDRFEPSETGSEWFANDTLDIRGNWRPALGVVADLGYKPYVLENPDGSENTSIVTEQFFLHIGGSLVLFDRLRLGVSLPIAISQSGSANGGVVNGQQIVDPGGAGVGDLRLAADLRLFGNYGDAFTLGFGARVWFPTGDTQKLLGDGDFRIGPHVSVAGDLGAIAYAASVGVIYRGNDQSFAGHPTGSAAWCRLRAGRRRAARSTRSSSSAPSCRVKHHRLRLERGGLRWAHDPTCSLLGGAHYSAGDFRFGLGAGPGLSHAAGTAAFRGLLSVEYAPGVPPPPPPPPEPAPEPVIPPPPVLEPPPPSDRDHDGIVDTEDACPDVPGVRTDDPKTNGCPSDRDHDGIPDTVDACPDVPWPGEHDPTKNGVPAGLHQGQPDQDLRADQVPLRPGGPRSREQSRPRRRAQGDAGPHRDPQDPHRRPHRQPRLRGAEQEVERCGAPPRWRRGSSSTASSDRTPPSIGFGAWTGRSTPTTRTPAGRETAASSSTSRARASRSRSAATTAPAVFAADTADGRC